MLRNVFGGCVSDNSTGQSGTFRSSKIKFGLPIDAVLKNGCIPGPLVDILVLISQKGVSAVDVFRRPGNPNDIRHIVKHLSEGKQVIYSNYSFYSLASVVKKFLLRTPGGVLTVSGEESLLKVLSFDDHEEQCHAIYHVIGSLKVVHQYLLTLLFGTWFRIISNSDENAMSVEALSRSVAGSMFHTCADDPCKVEKASCVMQLLIESFTTAAVFGHRNISFFADITHTSVQVRELMHCEYRCMDEGVVSVSTDVEEVTKMVTDIDQELCRIEIDEASGAMDGSLELSPLVGLRRSIQSHNIDLSSDVSQLEFNISTLSAPDVSLMPSPEVSLRPKSLEDNLIEVRLDYQSRCLSRFNSVKRKQLERMRQRSDWFLNSDTSFSNGNRSSPTSALHCSSHRRRRRRHPSYCSDENGGSESIAGNSHRQPSSGNGLMKASSEGTVLEVYTDDDSVFADHSSLSGSPTVLTSWSPVRRKVSPEMFDSDALVAVATSEPLCKPNQPGHMYMEPIFSLDGCRGTLGDYEWNNPLTSSDKMFQRSGCM